MRLLFEESERRRRLLWVVLRVRELFDQFDRRESDITGRGARHGEFVTQCGFAVKEHEKVFGVLRESRNSGPLKETSGAL